MAPTRHSSSTVATFKPVMTRPVRTNAGKGGYLSQMRRTTEAIDQPQRERAKDLLDNESVNRLAPTQHHRKKRNGKQRAKVSMAARNSIAC